MACTQSLEKWIIKYAQPISKSTTKQNPNQQLSLSIGKSRRSAILISTLPFSFTLLLPQTSEARERRNRKNLPLQDYLTSPDGLKYYDVVEGKGALAEKGSTVEVHFDCMFRGITAISSRESKLLAGNRTIAQRTVIVPPEAGYGQRGMNEIPPGASFELNIELLQ